MVSACAVRLTTVHMSEYLGPLMMSLRRFSSASDMRLQLYAELDITFCADEDCAVLRSTFHVLNQWSDAWQVIFAVV
jgi:hypothetical protein